MEKELNWGHKDEWRLRGNDFMVVVSRHAVEMPDAYRIDGPHRWCVYAYIYPKHPHFAAFSGDDDMLQEAAQCLPLHGGPSLMRMHWDKAGKALSAQVGADYNHLHDDRFTHYETRVAARDVFDDAETLFERLQRMAEDGKPVSVALEDV